jgi:hypothetical protein
MVMRAPRRPNDGEVREVLIDVVSESEPLPQDWVGLLLSRFTDKETVEFFTSGEYLRNLGEAVQLLAFARLRRTVREADMEDLRWGVATGRAFVDLLHTFADVLESVGLPPTADPQVYLLAHIGRALRRLRTPRPVATAALGPLMVLLGDLSLHWGMGRRWLDEAAEWSRKQTVIFGAILAIAPDLPKRWWPYLGPGGPLLAAGMPPDEREEFLATVEQWVSEHADEFPGVAVGRSEIPAQQAN